VLTLIGQAIIQGLVFGSIYAIAALGFGLVYHTTGVFHIAYGAILALATYVVVTVSAGLSQPSTVLAVAAGLAVAVIANVLVYLAIYRTLERRGASSMIVFVASLGASMALQAGTLLVFGAAVLNFDAPDLLRVHFFGGVGISYFGVATIAIGLLAAAAVTWLMSRTRWGFEVQAVASNRSLAEGIGIRPLRVLVGVYAVASVLSVISGVLLGVTTSVVAPMGTNLALLAAIGVLVGGAQRYTAPYLGGLLLGLVQAGAATLLPGEWSVSAVFVMFLVVILLKPTGLMGAPRR